MKRITLGSTGLRVSPLALGTANYGLPPLADEQASRQMDRFLERGGNFLDTAECYSDWVPGEKSRSEALIGRYLAQRGNRDQWVISTKGGHPDLRGDPRSRLDPDSIQRDLHGSLARLGTHQVELYFLHRDDRSIPVGEMLHALEQLKGQGLILHYGCSNWSLPRLKEARAYAARQGWAGFEVNQIQWSLARLNVDQVADKTLEALTPAYYQDHVQTGMALMAYTSLAKGYFSKRLQGEAVSPLVEALYGNADNRAILRVLEAHERAAGGEPTQVSLQWFARHPFPAVPVVSASSAAQLEQVLDALAEDAPPLPDGLPTGF